MSVCTGCGLTSDDEDRLIYDVATWPHACAVASGGTDLYCDPTSQQLKGPPAKHNVRVKMENIPDLSAFGPCAPIGALTVIGGPVTGVDFTTFDFTNPSDCLPMQMWASAGLQHAIFDFVGPGRTQFFIGAQVIFSGGINLGPLDMGHQVHDLIIPAGETHSYDNSGTFFERPVGVLPAGGTVTVTLRTMAQSLAANGTSCVRQLSTAIFLHGYNA